MVKVINNTGHLIQFYEQSLVSRLANFTHHYYVVKRQVVELLLGTDIQDKVLYFSGLSPIPLLQGRKKPEYPEETPEVLISLIPEVDLV